MARTPLVSNRTTSEIAADLNDLVRGEVRSDPYSLSLYSTDASVYEIEPLVVVNPLDEDDVRQCVYYAAANNLPIIARGAGSGLTGESLGRAIVLDLNVHMARIIELDRQNRTVVVEAGVVLDSLNRALKPYGFRIGPDPASSNRCTIGGMINNNSCGARSLKYGATRDNLVSCRVVLSDGTVTNFRPIRQNGSTHERKQNEEGMAGRINRDLPKMLEQNAELITKTTEKMRAERNRSGYLVNGVVEDGVFDPARLICGSEGTLGFVTEAVLKVVPLPEKTGLVAVCFDTLVQACEAVPAIRRTHPVACELLDGELLHLGRQAKPDHAELLPEDAGAMLVVEYEGATVEAVEEQCQELEQVLAEVKHQGLAVFQDEAEQAALWATRKAAVPLLFQRPDGKQPIPFVEDGAVPVDRLAEYVGKAVGIFQKYGLDYSAYGHAGHGEPHLRPYLDLTNEDDIELMPVLAEECHKLVWSCEGTISGEHGEGLARAQFIEGQVGEEMYQLFRDIKDLFDPRGLMNPDKKITDDPELMTRNLRFGASWKFSQGEKPKHWHIDETQARNRAMFQAQTAITKERTVENLAPNPNEVEQHGRAVLNWSEGELEFETKKCNGNGFCRSTGPEVGMCPRFKYNRVEDASPRAKSNIIRRLLTGRQERGSFSADAIEEIMDFCFNCKLCHHECPSTVNIPKMVMEAKARHYQSNGMPMDKWLFTQTETATRMGQYLAPLLNTLNEMPVYRYLMEVATGIDRRRPLPRLKTWRLRHRNTYDPSGPRPKVVLYRDLFARYHTPEVAQAAVDVLEHHNYEVIVPDAPWTNMPALSYGAVIEARKTIDAVTSELAPYAFEGIPIVSIEPTATVCLTQDFLYYTDTPATRAVARHTVDLMDFLVGLDGEGKLRKDFHTLNVHLGYHEPCQHRALQIGQPAIKLLKQVPGVEVDFMDHGCCGIAGAFGMLKKNYDESMWIGRHLFRDFGRKELRFGVTESSVCKMQMEHGVGKRAWHPIQVMAAAYGYEAAKPQEFKPDRLKEAGGAPKAHAHDEKKPAKKAASRGEKKDRAHRRPREGTRLGALRLASLKGRAALHFIPRRYFHGNAAARHQRVGLQQADRNPACDDAPAAHGDRRGAFRSPRGTGARAAVDRMFPHETQDQRDLRFYTQCYGRETAEQLIAMRQKCIGPLTDTLE